MAAREGKTEFVLLDTDADSSETFESMDEVEAYLIDNADEFDGNYDGIEVYEVAAQFRVKHKRKDSFELVEVD